MLAAFILSASSCGLSGEAPESGEEIPLTASQTATAVVVQTATPTQTSSPVQETEIPGDAVPDIIFINGRILTMDRQLRTMEALAVSGDMIIAVGSNEEVEALGGPSTQTVDLRGHALMPGFVDAHTHILNDAEGYLGLNLDEAQDLALENGITTLANMYVNPDFIEELRDLERNARLRVRTSAYLIATDNCGGPQGDWYEQYPPTDEFGEMLRIGGVKIFLDGGTCGYPAVSEETHPDAGQGDLFLSDGELAQIVGRADAAGYQIAIHALGDRAIDQAIDALNAVIDAPGNPERHRVEHSFYMIDGQFSRFSEMGIHPIIFGYWPTCSADASERSPAWRDSIRRWRELVDANPGIVIAAKTDMPWLGPPSPLLELYSLTTLREEAPDGSICEPAPWLADRTLTIEEALPMVTSNPAYILFREDEVGSLEPGKLADLIVLSESPLDIDVNELKDIEIWMTMVGGQTAYCATGMDIYCP
jgi:predicted amidohydrolase YtcJ